MTIRIKALIQTGEQTGLVRIHEIGQPPAGLGPATTENLVGHRVQIIAGQPDPGDLRAGDLRNPSTHRAERVHNRALPLYVHHAGQHGIQPPSASQPAS